MAVTEKDIAAAFNAAGLATPEQATRAVLKLANLNRADAAVRSLRQQLDALHTEFEFTEQRQKQVAAELREWLTTLDQLDQDAKG